MDHCRLRLPLYRISGCRSCWEQLLAAWWGSHGSFFWRTEVAVPKMLEPMKLHEVWWFRVGYFLDFLLECVLIEAPNVPSSPRNGLGHVHALFSARSCSMVLRERKRLRALPNLSSVPKHLCGMMVSQWGRAAQTSETNQDGIVTTLHLTCVESLAWCSSLFLGGLVESWAHWAQGSEDERSQHCASFAGHGGDLQVASVFPQKLWHHTVVLLLNCEVKNPQISPRCINRRIPWRKLHVVAHLSSKLCCHPSHHISSYLAYLGSVVSCASSHLGTMREVEESPLLAPRLNKSPGSASSWVERAMVSTAASSCEAVPMTLEPGNGWEWIHPQSHSDY